MPKWDVSFNFYLPRGTARVEGANWNEAHAAANARGAELAAEMGEGVHYSADLVRQIGEPWARSQYGGWYDVNTTDVVVVERACGHFFTAEDVELLESRINRFRGLTVSNHWNGEGQGQVSFRVRGRRTTRPMTKSMLAKLLAPRPESAHRGTVPPESE